MKNLIVSRHPATVAYLRDVLGPEWADAPVVASATPEDVRGAVVAGNLPLHLAALAAEVIAVEFSGEPPRGQEYGRAEMEAAGVRLTRYRVSALGALEATPTVAEPPVLLREWRSTNGRWGVQIVGPAAAAPAFKDRWGWGSKALPGALIPLGRLAGMESFRYDPAAAGFVVLAGDAEPVAGTPCSLIYGEGLQSSEFVTLLAAQPGGRWREWGYKQRSSRYYELRSDGAIAEVPAAVLAAERSAD